MVDVVIDGKRYVEEVVTTIKIDDVRAWIDKGANNGELLLILDAIRRAIRERWFGEDC